MFKISGLERRKLKKELNLLKYYHKHFWHSHQLDKDMASFYGTTDTYPMKDDKAQTMYDTDSLKIKQIEEQLAEEKDDK